MQVTQFRKMFPTMDRFANQSFAAKLKDTAGMIDTVKQVCAEIVSLHLNSLYTPGYCIIESEIC